MLLEYAQEVEVEATHHRFMPWCPIAWSNPNPYPDPDPNPNHNPNPNPNPDPDPDPDPNPNPSPNPSPIPSPSPSPAPGQVGYRVAAATRDHEHDGLLAQLLPLYDPLRHVR